MTVVPTNTLSELQEAVQRLDAESGGILQFATFRRAEFDRLAQEAMGGDLQAQRATLLAGKLIDRIGGERAPKLTLCSACPRQLRKGIGAVCVAIPMSEQANIGLAVGLCPRCSATAEVAHANGTAAMRRLWPDLEDKGPLHHQVGRA